MKQLLSQSYLMFAALLWSLYHPMKAEHGSFFGTDGIRKTVGIFPLTNEALPQLGHALALWGQTKYGTKSPRFLLASDTRLSAHYIKAALSSGLLLHPVVVYDAGILPTPVVHHLLQTGEYDCGLIITASHNQYHDNGIKIIDTKESKLHQSDETVITRMMNNKPVLEPANLGTMVHLNDPTRYYKTMLLQTFPAQFLQGKTVILDCAHGATSQLAQEAFELFGARVIMINNQPNGININYQCGAVDTSSLEQAMMIHQADAGFAFDGDGDRIIAINKQGHVKDGDDILYLLSKHPEFAHHTVLVSSIMANQGLEQQLLHEGKQLIRTAVGDKYVCEALQHHQLVLGAEPSGHVIISRHIASSDGIFCALTLMQSIILTDNMHMKTFEKMPNILINIAVSHKKDLTSPDVASIINEYTRRLEAGRLLVRYSGTENVLRIMVEDKTYDHAYSLAHELSMKLSHIIT